MLAHNIRVAASERGLALNQLADFAEVSRSQLYDVLNCKKRATIDWIAKIAKPLKVEP